MGVPPDSPQTSTGRAKLRQALLQLSRQQCGIRFQPCAPPTSRLVGEVRSGEPSKAK